MLRSLFIKNYALIEEITVQFERGLNIITGETGAGKSIILDAFSLLIGERASSDVVRHGATKAIVEAEFELEGNPKLRAFLKRNELENESDVLLIRREVQAKGSSRGFINDTPASTQLLKELGDYIVDLHGQHEHQSLLNADGHIELLDEFGGLTEQVEEYRAIRTQFNQINRELEELRSREDRLKEERELYEYQLNEILSVDPRENEDQEIDEELKKLENAEELTESANSIHDLLYEVDGSAYEKLNETKQRLERLLKFDPSLEEQLKEVRSSITSIEELSRFFGKYPDRLQYEPARLTELRERIQSITRLKKKYGNGSLDVVLQKKADLQEKLQPGASVEEKKADLEKQLRVLSMKASKIAADLSTKRKKLARTLEPEIMQILKRLGIEHSTFETRIEQSPLDKVTGVPLLMLDSKVVAANSHGADEVEFYLSTNAGESPKPLTKVASGGEISRIMLALKTVLAKTDRLPLMIFDEIDVGVSGRVAQAVGRAMKDLGAQHQIIAITHLAQIAAFADAHYLVAKRTSNGATFSKLERLPDERHVEEVARLIAGAELSESSLLAARELIAESTSKESAQKKKAKAIA
jgi:DNA repair protein RecN (Recombination protein N)